MSECQECGNLLDIDDFREGHHSNAVVDEDFGVAFVVDIFSHRGFCAHCNTYNNVEEINECEISLRDYYKNDEQLLDRYYKGLARR